MGTPPGGDSNIGKGPDRVDESKRSEGVDASHNLLPTLGERAAFKPNEMPHPGDAPMTVAQAGQALDGIFKTLQKIGAQLGPEVTAMLNDNIKGGEYDHPDFPLGTVMKSVFQVTPKNEEGMRAAFYNQINDLNKKQT